MPTLTAITLYPIKSCAGLSLQEATLTEAGLMTQHIYDREWMVVDAAGRFMTQREHPRMALIVPRLKGETLELRAPGMLRLEIPLGLPHPEQAVARTVQVWDDSVLAYDCDALTATWFSNAIGVPCRLVRFHADALRKVSEKWTQGVAATTLFSDGYPVLVAGAASLDDLNARLVAAGRDPVPMNRFRPNLVIAGLEAFEEDYAAAYRLGEAELRPVKPCSRCPIPSVDQDTAQIGPDPVDLLRSYRAKPELDGAICFGMNAIVMAGAGQRIRLGQEVDVELAFL
ncbi:MOSC N-terminal beta barrel domain-containing protein [Duganella sp. FT3S]|uniref:MOSC N-terminal beta barrel domain-containing protein n=1 Tax=Rugamonas fusca TaxID=2758568 RepID=A0A7W2EHH1_9BURK|nr:MOSC N-terminal beta barrel domain-containing protein [Rugamonas fusca]MBA5606008.1 MOSC N-terminal beta barrel domain-containing protein [Rugamonas fusca]